MTRRTTRPIKSKKRAKPTKKVSSKKRKSPSRSKKPSKNKFLNKYLGMLPWRYLFAILFIVSVAYSVYLDLRVQNQFDGKRWALPAKVYARPLELYSGLALSENKLLRELKMLGFRNVENLKHPGSFYVDGNEVVLTTRAFQFWDEKSDSNVIKISFDNNHISGLYNFSLDKDVDVMRLEPVIIGGIYPSHKEDRLLVKFDSVPELLKSAITIVEDRNFYQHHGLDYKGIARAMWANLRAGKTVQGGSTLTQQLVKNFFLSNQRSLWRKANEAVMALLVEWHYDKQEIFEAYLNEIYLGQDKVRAIHGFGLASRYYFDRDIDDLELQHIAMLVALVKGPSFYSPHRHSKRLIKRRNLVIDMLAQFNVITKYDASMAKRKALGIVKSKPNSISLHPAFLDLVKRQLKTFYREKDLATEGLQIFTTLDPFIQQHVERVIKQKTKQLDRLQGLRGKLQAATLVTNTTNSEILALVGDSKPKQSGFNRALDALRPIGSLIKPAIYLTALADDQDYNPLSLIEDTALHLKGPSGDVWSPQNYDKRIHGQVPFYQALSYSYNLATVRLGLNLGFESIQQTIKAMGINRSIPAYPSMLLGAVNMSPYEVTQMYHSLASGGFHMPLSAIREVVALDGTPLKRFPLKIRQTLDIDSVKIINSILNNVTTDGTARRIGLTFPSDFVAAGKTGTTDDLRDSWFAGFTGQHLVVTWLGTDDNKSTGLTGSSGALRVWAAIMKKIQTQPMVFNSSDTVEYIAVNPDSNKHIDASCSNAVFLIVAKDTVPEQQGICGN